VRSGAVCTCHVTMTRGNRVSYYLTDNSVFRNSANRSYTRARGKQRFPRSDLSANIDLLTLIHNVCRQFSSVHNPHISVDTIRKNYVQIDNRYDVWKYANRRLIDGVGRWYTNVIHTNLLRQFFRRLHTCRLFLDLNWTRANDAIRILFFYRIDSSTVRAFKTFGREATKRHNNKYRKRKQIQYLYTYNNQSHAG